MIYIENADLEEKCKENVPSFPGNANFTRFF